MNRGPRETLIRRTADHFQSILDLSSLVQDSLIDAVDSLEDQDLEKARLTYQKDRQINQIRYQVEQEALITVATQQPFASDLRKLASILDIAGELERIGDYAKGIARIALRIGDQPLLKPFGAIPRMADLTADMLERAVKAFIAGDEAGAVDIVAEDDQIDLLYNNLYRELLELMIEDRKNIDQATFLLLVAHNLERAADRVTNICERVVFTTSGKMEEFDRSDDEIEDF